MTMQLPTYRIQSRRDLVRALLPFATPDTRQGVLRFCIDYGLFLLGTAVALLSAHIALRVAGALLAGFKMSTLYAVAHDAAHNTLTASRRLNKAIGIAAYLTGFYNYRLRLYDHLLRHHPLVNGPQPDAYRPLSLAEYRALKPWRRAWERFIRSPNPLALMAYGASSRLLKSEVFPKKTMPAAVRREAWLYAALMGAYLCAFVAIIGVASQGSPALFAQNLFFALALPFMAFQACMAAVVYFQHTHPAVPWFAPGDERHQGFGAEQLSVHLALPRAISSWLHHAYCHAAHHVCPSIPCYRLYDAQLRLDGLLGRHAAVVPFSAGALLDVFRRCKLYDYEAHRWIDFDGTPTSPRLVAQRKRPARSANQSDFQQLARANGREHARRS
jgi:acyl-lipid omega-6 desaturase (Delta-12 desaturase)